MSIRSLFFRLTPWAYSLKRPLLANRWFRGEKRLKIIGGYYFLFIPHQQGVTKKVEGEVLGEPKRFVQVFQQHLTEKPKQTFRPTHRNMLLIMINMYFIYIYIHTHTYTDTHSSGWEMCVCVCVCVCSVVKLHLTVCNPMDARLPCPSPSPGAYSNSCPLSWWCYLTISSSVVPISSCL